MRVPVLILLPLLWVFAQQSVPQPPRDVLPRRPAGPTGTAAIRGQVVASDTGNPIRKANVSLSPIAPTLPAGRGAGGTTTARGASTTTFVTPAGARGTMTAGMSVSFAGPRQVTTDAQGGFEFTGLPAGKYRISASPSQYSAQYLGMAYGAKKPGGPFASDFGQPIEVADGQVFNKATIALPRGGVITGRVTDENGDPLARVQVSTVFFLPGVSRGQRTGGGQTDDLGQFRLYGLQPGNYAVLADARGNTYVAPNAPPEREEDKIGFVTTYYPGTPDEGEAQRVRVGFGAETAGIEIRLVQGRLFRVSGTITDSQGRGLARGNGSLTKRTPGMNGFSNFGFSTDEQGQFQMRNIPPGNYRLVVRENRPMPTPPAPGAQPEPVDMAIVPLTIAGDVDNLVVATAPGVTIGGQIVFEQGPPTPMPKEMRVNAMIGNPEDSAGLPSPQPALVTPQQTFTMKGLMGEYLLRASVGSQFLKSVAVNGEDITDTPREFKSSDRVTITLTSRASTLEGIVTGAGGEVSAEVMVMLFSEDKESWRSNSTRLRRSTTNQEGQFRMPGLMPGRYLIVAGPRERFMGPAPDASFFEQLAKEATPLVVGEDEQRKVDLKMLEGTGGQLPTPNSQLPN